MVSPANYSILHPYNNSGGFTVMDYKIPQPDDGATELREPAAAYCPGITVAEPWADEDLDELDDDSGFWDEEDKICRSLPTDPSGRKWSDLNADDDPEFGAAVLRRSDEVDARIAAGERMYTTEEVFAELEWCIKHDKWDDVIERMKKEGRYGQKYMVATRKLAEHAFCCDVDVNVFAPHRGASLGSPR
jgi:hypothetical protein